MGNTANARALFERALAEVTGEASAPLWDRFLQVRRSARAADEQSRTVAMAGCCASRAPLLRCGTLEAVSAVIALCSITCMLQRWECDT